jgi:hypothetical protein
MKLVNRLKSWIVKNFDSKYFEIFGNKYIYLTKIPSGSYDVISDLFPLRIEDNWNSHFELLNLPRLINPIGDLVYFNEIEIYFFNKKGDFLNSYNISMHDELKTTIDLKKIANSIGIFHDGTFAVFHKNKFDNLSYSKSFITDRGYVGYENSKFGRVKGYVHGNFDAISKGKNLKLLGITSFYKKNYNIQYEFNPNNTYELFWVNTSNRRIKIKINRSTMSNENDYISIKPGGIKSYLLKNSTSSKLIITSTLNMARPVIFKYMQNSFDVFHG